MSRSRPMASAPDDIWSKLLAQRDAGPAKPATTEAAEGDAPPAVTITADGLETYLLFVGAKSSGKSTLIVQFLNPNKDDKPKPTVALEYTFGRRSNTASNVKDLAHIWELGGGTHLKELVNVPITPQRAPSAAVVIVADLSEPGTVLNTVLTWLKIIGERVRECCAKMKRVTPEKLEEMKAAAAARMNLKPDSAEAKMINPSLVPIVIVCTKYDQFRDVDSSRRKQLMMALRFIAHCHGASLLCTSHKEKAQLNYFRAQLNHYVFHTEPKKYSQLDPSKPLVIPAGSDSLDSIGMPQGASRAQMDTANVDARIKLWQRVVDTFFPPVAEEAAVEARAGEDEYLEPIVDAMRAQKGEELDRYIKEAERKLRAEQSASKSKGGRGSRARGGAGAGAGAGAGVSKSRARRK